MKSCRHTIVAVVLVAVVTGATGCGGTGGGGADLPIISALTIQTTIPSILTAIAGRPYSQPLQATGGVPPYTWTLTNDFKLPNGLTLDSTGVISGNAPAVPDKGSGNTFIVQVHDAASHTAQATLLINIANILAVTSSSLPEGNNGISYSQVLQTFGGAGNQNWNLAPGSPSLPAGLTLASNGSISGTPTEFGTFHPTVQVSDSSNPVQKAIGSVTLVIDNKLIIVSQSLPIGIVSRSYDQPLAVVGGIPPYNWSKTGGNLPAGVTLFSTGHVTGMPSSSGFFSINVQVVDSASQSQSASLSVSLQIQPVLTITNPSLNDAVLGLNSTMLIGLNGGLAPFHASITSGALPDGILLNPLPPQGGVIALSGITTKTGTFNFTIQATDSSSPPFTPSQEYTVHVSPQLVLQPVPLPNGLVGQLYSYQFQATGGLVPLHWSTSPNTTLPPGITIDSLTGVISGTPSLASNFAFGIVVSDSGNGPQQVQVGPRLDVLGKLSITTSQLPSISQNAPISIQFEASGGIGQYTWTRPSGMLPTGLALDPSTGTISGQATQTGSSTFTVQVTDAGPPAQTSVPVALQVTVGGKLGRNDSIATATTVSNGTYQASISPYSDPPNGVGNPDSDYYKVMANPGAIVTIDGRAARLIPPSPLEFVLELVDSNGDRLSNCTTGKTPSGPFGQLCLSVANTNFNTSDPTLILLVPSDASGPMTFYAHALDFRGDARPDFIYTITISGAN